jgi:hypothetical protein
MRYVSMLLWSTSTLNGAAWKQCLLTLDAGLLTLRTESSVVFSVAVVEVRVHFTPLAGMVLTVAGEGFKLVDVGSVTTPEPSARLLSGLRVEGVVGNDVYPGRGFGSVSRWHQVLSESGSTVTGTRGRGLVYLVGGSFLGLAIGVGFVVTAVVLATSQ